MFFWGGSDKLGRQFACKLYFRNRVFQYMDIVKYMLISREICNSFYGLRKGRMDFYPLSALSFVALKVVSQSASNQQLNHIFSGKIFFGGKSVSSR